ncbi:class A sortase [Listeria monocytogenes]|uniref:class A sortase n=1 Tax=Listeria monocytogenes TaxID=1639 RepID=UPI0011EAAFAE|nr:class A sortase [Listeria monocytogenes]TYU82856.1 class A sortase [Listeria monocytogenes]
MVKFTHRRKPRYTKNRYILIYVFCCFMILFIHKTIIQNQEMKQVSQQTAKNVSVAYKNDSKKNIIKTDDKTRNDVDRLSWKDFMSFQGSAQETNIASNSIGIIEIPSIHLYLPVIKGTNNSNLRVGATTFREYQSLADGNYVLLGHNMGKSGVLFSDVPDLKKGDKIYIYQKTDKGQKKLSYCVKSIKEIDKNQTTVLENTDIRRLTLITCSSKRNTSKRIVVTANPI